MDVWVWVAIYAVALTVIQLLLYRFLVRRGKTFSESASIMTSDPEEFDYERGERPIGSDRARERFEARAGRRSRGPTVDADRARRCGECGAENEADTTFDRCWNCAAQL